MCSGVQELPIARYLKARSLPPFIRYQIMFPLLLYIAKSALNLESILSPVQHFSKKTKTVKFICDSFLLIKR
jgi:hypothetical protein